MAETPKTAQDQRLKAFFRDTLQSEPGVEGELAERMAERCVQSIDRLLSDQAPQGAPRPAIAALQPALPTTQGFDPFAFSAVAVLARNGREALMARLAEIKEPLHLSQLAEAQHLAIEQGLSDINELRLAIVRGVERRIASRRAAAS